MSTRRPIVVAGFDGSPASEQAVAWATGYARSTGGTLRLVTAWDWPTFQDAPIVYGDYDPARTARGQLRRVARHSGLPSDLVDLVVGKGGAAHVLLEQATDADLLVVGSRGMGGFSRMLLGSVSSAIVHHAPCPVAIIRSAADARAADVVVGVDDSRQSLQALRWAMDYAELTHAPLTVVTVIQSVPPRTPVRYALPNRELADDVSAAVEVWLAELLEKEQVVRAQRLEPEPQLLVVEGDPSGELVRRTDGADLIVVGSRGMGGFRRLMLGSVGSALAHHADCSVVVVREPHDDAEES
jgi:nucleotide-binding universal stress UspA family protein